MIGSLQVLAYMNNRLSFREIEKYAVTRMLINAYEDNGLNVNIGNSISGQDDMNIS